MQLVAYFYGIGKDRRLCEEVRYNLAYRWFCRRVANQTSGNSAATSDGVIRSRT